MAKFWLEWTYEEPFAIIYPLSLNSILGLIYIFPRSCNFSLRLIVSLFQIIFLILDSLNPNLQATPFLLKTQTISRIKFAAIAKWKTHVEMKNYNNKPKSQKEKTHQHG